MDFRIGSFDPSRMSWDRYAEQLSYFLEASKVDEKLRLPTILTVIGDQVFNLLCDLIAPARPGEKTAEEILSTLEQHFNPKPLSRIERFKLRERLQLPTETTAEYAAQLRKIAVNCDLGDRLNFTLSEQFIYGLKDFHIKKRLIMEKTEVDFVELIKLASAAEISSCDLNKLENRTVDKFSAFSIKENSLRGSKTQQSFNKKRNPCKHCGAFHSQELCKYKNAICNLCKKLGHIKPICRQATFKSSKNKTKSTIHVADSLTLDSETIINSHQAVNQIISAQPIIIKLLVDNHPCDFELDTGAAVSIMPLSTFKSIWPDRKLDQTRVTLRAFEHIITPVGTCKVLVKYNNKSVSNLELFVTKVGSISLLGRSWLHALGFTTQLFKDIHLVDSSQSTLKSILSQFEKLFNKDLGNIKNFEAKLYLKKDSIPKYCKHRSVPFALIPAVEEELHKLQKQGIITPIKFSRWAAPIVPILKKNGTLRICADYKVGLNQCLNVDTYPLPIIDDMLAKLSKGKIFSKLDLAQAYQQVRMDQTSAELLTINTHLGLFSVSRLPFGISSAPAIFQGLMDSILKSQKNVVCYLDDILIASPDISSHFSDLTNIFEILLGNGIRLNLEKCEFLKDKVEYLGHVINESGVSPNPAKLKALLSAPAPSNSDQLRSFLGLLGYYRKFVPDLATKITHLNSLLSKQINWDWNESCQKEFELIKKILTSDKVLTHYDPSKPLILAADASPYGLGAVLSHIFPDKSEKPIMFASRSLTTTEKNYSQLDREALGIIFAVKKFHKYILGRHFTLYTDHKPLTRIFSISKEVPSIAASRLQRWSLILAGYSFDIKYKPSKEHSNADALSRLPINCKAATEENMENIFNIQQNEHFPWTKADIAEQTKLDPDLSKIINYLKDGWPRNLNKNLNPLTEWTKRKDQLSLQEGCILWGLRVIIPSTLRTSVLKELHQCHIGMTKMKLLARSICWWPGIDKHIENEAKSCRTCQLQQKDPPKTTLHPWIRPTGPWIRLHTDLLGPYKNKMFLVTVDSYSKWPEIQALHKADSYNIMQTLEEYFGRFGYPEHLVSDNGTPFTSNEFEAFCKNRGIFHSKSPPFHPASNGQAERFVDIAKTFLSKLENVKESDWQVRLNEILFKYRCTPHATLKSSPAELLLGRQVRGRLQKVNPLPIIPQLPFKSKYKVNQNILARLYGKNDQNKWMEGRIATVLSPVTFKIIFKDGREGKRHFNQLRPSYLSTPPAFDENASLFLDPANITTTHPRAPASTVTTQPRGPTSIPTTQPRASSEQVPPTNNTSQPIRRSARPRRPPQRLVYKH